MKSVDPFDKYLDPPDDDPICNECGEALVPGGLGELGCNNKYCPRHFDKGSREYDLAVEYCEALETIRHLRFKAKRLEEKVRSLTQVKSEEVLRDTEYQITRMSDAIEYAYSDCGLDGEGYWKLSTEFEKCKKIMRSKE